jgi:hypothetical protein
MLMRLRRRTALARDVRFCEECGQACGTVCGAQAGMDRARAELLQMLPRQ